MQLIISIDLSHNDVWNISIGPAHNGYGCILSLAMGQVETCVGIRTVECIHLFV